MNRFGNRRNSVGELVLLHSNSSPKASRRLRHALFYLTFGHNAAGTFRHREPVMSAPETRRERRARLQHDKLAAEALAKQVRSLDAWATMAPLAPLVEASIPTKPRPRFGRLPTDIGRKITGAVRRGLARGKKA